MTLPNPALVSVALTGPTAMDRALELARLLTVERSAYVALEPWPDGDWCVYYKPENDGFVKRSGVPLD